MTAPGTICITVPAMVIPLVDEAGWRDRLYGLPPWQPTAEHILVVSPHPDDETLGAGGLIARLAAEGKRVTVLAVTDGENAYANEPGQAETRCLEQTQALARLGVEQRDICRLRLPDSNVTAFEARLASALGSLAGTDTHLIAPWRGDFHPDHEACGRAAESVASAKGIPLTSYLFWTYHRGAPETLSGMTLLALPLTAEEQRAKQEALACHRSQLAHPSGQPILPSDLLWPAALPYEVFLPA